jgi:YHS domain-containing protein
MFKEKIAVSAIALTMSAGLFVAGAMPMEKDSMAKGSDQTVTTVASEGKSAKKLKPQTTCPVMGGKIDKKVFADYDGKRVYFCCPGCIETFKKDPAKYLKKMQEAGEEPEVVKK